MAKKRWKPRIPKLFMKSPCPTCGKMISNCGFAYTKHDDMHRRKGELPRLSCET